MEKLILGCLVLIFFENLFSLYNNAFVVRLNYRTHERREKDLSDRLARATKEGDELLRLLVENQRAQTDKMAMVLTVADGVKLLPENWRKKLFEKDSANV